MAASYVVSAVLFALLEPWSPPVGAYDRSAIVAQICTIGYARAHRHVPYRVRDRVYDRYGLARGHRRGYVIDHLIPLEIGGTNDEANLWPQLRIESHRKDRDEDRIRGEVCDGRLTLPEARAEMFAVVVMRASAAIRMRLARRIVRTYDTTTTRR